MAAGVESFESYVGLNRRENPQRKAPQLHMHRRAGEKSRAALPPQEVLRKLSCYVPGNWIALRT